MALTKSKQVPKQPKSYKSGKESRIGSIVWDGFWGDGNRRKINEGEGREYQNKLCNIKLATN